MQMSTLLPTFNFSSKALIPGSSSWVSTCDDVRVALEEHGCFIAVCDNVPLELHHKVLHVLEGLFKLPGEIKAKNVSSKPFHGYSKPQFPLHLLESLGIEDAQDLQKAKEFTSLMWPSGNQDFCEAIYEYSKKGCELEQVVKRMVFESYGVGNYVKPLNDSSHYLLRVARYRGPTAEESNVGSVPHSDKSFLTVLHQNDVDGLEVQPKHDNNSWIPCKLTPQTFVVMAGEALAAWSNNRIHAPIHRVAMNGDRIRYSLGTFSFIDGVKIATPPELIDLQHPMQFKPFDHYGLLQFYTREDTRLSDFTVKDYCGV